MFERITEAEINKRSMANVSTTPNRKTAFGESGLNDEALKLRFDRLGRYLAGRLNEVFDGLSNGEFTKAALVVHNEKTVSLYDFISRLLSGNGDDIKLETAQKTITLSELAEALVGLVDKIKTGDLAKEIVVSEGKSLEQFYNQTNDFIDKGIDEITEQVIDSIDAEDIKVLLDKALEGIDLQNLQEKTDETLETESKEVVGAINEVHSELDGKMLSVRLSNDHSSVMQDIINAIEEAGGDISKVNIVTFTGYMTGCYTIQFNYYGGNTYNVKCSDIINSKKIYNALTDNTVIDVTTARIDVFLSYAIDCRTEIVETLETEDKTVVGGINEVNSKIGDIESALDELHAYAQSLVNGGESE